MRTGGFLLRQPEHPVSSTHPPACSLSLNCSHTIHFLSHLPFRLKWFLTLQFFFFLSLSLLKSFQGTGIKITVIQHTLQTEEMYVCGHL